MQVSPCTTDAKEGEEVPLKSTGPKSTLSKRRCYEPMNTDPCETGEDHSQPNFSQSCLPLESNFLRKGS